MNTNFRIRTLLRRHLRWYGEPPRERAVISRMGLPGSHRHQTAVARRHRVGTRHDLTDVVLRHVERHDGRVAGNHQLDGRDLRRETPRS